MSDSVPVILVNTSTLAGGTPLQLFPNPVTGPTLWIAQVQKGNLDVQVVDLMGHTWPVQLLSSPVETMVGVGVAGLPAGVYNLNISDCGVLKWLYT